MVIKTIYFLALALFFFHCTGNLSPEQLGTDEQKTLNLTQGEKQVVKSSNEFGLKLFKEVVSTGGDSNIFISPLSVSMALGMTLNGAHGSTYDAMQSTLELNGLTEEEINQGTHYHNIQPLTIDDDDRKRIYDDDDQEEGFSSQNQKYCINCGAMLKRDSNFCASCGTKL